MVRGLIFRIRILSSIGVDNRKLRVETRKVNKKELDISGADKREKLI